MSDLTIYMQLLARSHWDWYPAEIGKQNVKVQPLASRDGSPNRQTTQTGLVKVQIRDKLSKKRTSKQHNGYTTT